MALTTIDSSRFHKLLLETPPASDQLKRVFDNYQTMLLCVLDTILKRCERSPQYPYLDTKINLLDGTDFDPTDPIRGKNRIYTWIQGRGLEALAGHDLWIARSPQLGPTLKGSLHRRIREILVRVLDRMEYIRAKHHGRLFFLMTADGEPLEIDPDGRPVKHTIRPDDPYNLSDLFYAKGLAAAAFVLNDSTRLREAEELFQRICGDIRTERFASDQQALDPKNPVRPVTGRRSHGARMISLGGAALLLEFTGRAVYKEIGLEFIEHVLERHVQRDPNPAFGLPFDFWEFIDEQGRPYLEDGILRSDPGHATEFVGLALRFIHAGEGRGLFRPTELDKINAFKVILPKVLGRNFANGFSPGGYGIVKNVDLISRRQINSDMPWWSLPETMRAAMESARLLAGSDRTGFLSIFGQCSNAFVHHYVRRDLNLMAVQTLDHQGRPVAVIPATPDADPGYHTGLSLIDAITLGSPLFETPS